MTTPYSFTSCNSSDLLPLEARRLVTNCFLDPNWLTAFEKFSGIRMEPYHHIIAEGDLPVGFMPGFIQHKSLCGTLGERLFGRLCGLPFFYGWGTHKAFVCTSPWGFYSGIECGGRNNNEIYSAAIRYIDRIVKDRNLSVSGFPYVPKSSVELREQLEANGYRKFPVCPTTFLNLKWDSFEAYLADLPSKIRGDIKRERKRAKPLSLEWYENESLAVDFFGRPLSKILVELYNNTVQKYLQHPSPLNDNFLPQLWKMDRQNLRLCLARLDGKVVSFSLWRVFSGSAHAFMMGRDYDCPDKIPSYFSVVYTEPIIRGIKEGWKVLYFRPISYRAKLRRGCKIENLYLYVKGHNLLLQKFIDTYIAMSWKHFHDKWVPPKLYTY